VAAEHGNLTTSFQHYEIAAGEGSMIFMILFWGLIIFGTVALIRWLIQSPGRRSHLGTGTGFDAMDILKKRYAEGEIARDEFETMKKEILR